MEPLRAHETWTVWPILYFSADWPPKGARALDLGVSVIRAGEAALKAMRKLVKDASPKYPGEYVSDDAGEWVLALRFPRADIDKRFREQVEDAIVGEFLTALRLVRDTHAVCPIRFEAVVDGRGIRAETVKGADDYQIADYDEPAYEWTEEFRLDDLRDVHEVWAGLVALPDLRQWTNQDFLDREFRQLHTKAKSDAEECYRRRMPSGLSKKDRDSLASFFASDQEILKEAFGKAVARDRESSFRTRTLIGRALDLFNRAVFLPPLHAFLSMCLALETLWGRGEIRADTQTQSQGCEASW